MMMTFAWSPGPGAGALLEGEPQARGGGRHLPAEGQVRVMSGVCFLGPGAYFLVKACTQVPRGREDLQL